MIKAARLLLVVLTFAFATTACSSDLVGPDTTPVGQDFPWMGGGD